MLLGKRSVTIAGRTSKTQKKVESEKKLCRCNRSNGMVSIENESSVLVGGNYGLMWTKIESAATRPVGQCLKNLFSELKR